jgi:hypothetical protein
MGRARVKRIRAQRVANRTQRGRRERNPVQAIMDSPFFLDDRPGDRSGATSD